MFIGGLLVGIGVGELTGHVEAGTLIGLGAGFILEELLGKRWVLRIGGRHRDK